MAQHLIIANTGLQFVTWNWKPSFSALASEQPFYYFNVMDQMDRLRWFIEEVHSVELGEEEYLLKDIDFGRFQSKIAQAKLRRDAGEIQQLSQELSQYHVDDPLKTGNLSTEMRRWSGHWIPIPYVEKITGVPDHFDPSLAPRIYISPAEEGFDCTLCINTDSNNINLDGSVFNIASRAKSIFKFLDERQSLSGRLDYLENVYYKSEEEQLDGQGKAFASYISLIQALEYSQSGSIKFATRQNNYIPVDCFIDLGNSNTSVVLHEEADASKGFFSKCAALEIRDFNNPTRTYSGSFPSKIAFEKAGFASSEDLLDNNEFTWPSSTRIGIEAETLIQDHKGNRSSSVGLTYLSSPKRYLWDLRASESEWHFNSPHAISEQKTPVQLDGYSKSGELLNNLNGSRLKAAQSSRTAQNQGEHFGPLRFSKSALNRFFFIEIFAHAVSQINNPSFRKRMGDDHKRRDLRHIVVSCPTGMLQEEQATLRRYATEALAYVTNHPAFTEEQTESEIPIPKIHPSVKDVLKPMDSLGDRKSWMYDEATCVQLLYLFSTLQYQFNRNVASFLHSFNQQEKKNIRIGTIDLGGGTCDILVCDHNCDAQNDTVSITPKPRFWDSWMRAGDDLRKELVERVLVPTILTHMKDHTNIPDPARQLALLIGEESGQHDSAQVQFLRDFMQKVAMPITDLYLKHANDQGETFDVTYNDIFDEQGLSKAFLSRFNGHCQCRLEEIVWTIDPEKISITSQAFFEKQLKSISGVLGRLNCDIILLAGGTFKLRALEQVFLKGLGTMISRVQNLNHWAPGKWHPFTDGGGTLTDSKSHVSLGAAIALHGGVTKTLPGFVLNCDYLKTEIKSTARCLWRTESGKLAPIMSSKEINATLEVQTLPVLLKVSSIDSANYPAKQAYRIEVNKERLLQSIINRGTSESQAHLEVMEKTNELLAKNPFTMKLERDLSEGYESLKIVEIIDGNDEDVQPKKFNLIGQSLPEEEYWIEKGVHVHQL